MPEINAEMPVWLQERAAASWRGDPSVGQTMMQGFQLGAQQAAEKRRFALQATQAVVENKWREAQTTSMLLQNAERAAEAEDMQFIQLAQREYTHGNREIEPGLKSVQGHRTWATWKARFDAEQSDTFEYADFLKSYSALDGYGKSAVRAMGAIERGAILPEHYQILGNEQTRMREDALKLRYGTETIEVDGQKYIRNRSTGGLHAVPKDWSEGAPAVPIVDDDGTVLGYGLQNSRGGITQLRQPGAKRHPMQNKLDGLKADAEGAKASKSFKLSGLLAEIATLEKLIAEDQKPAVTQPRKGTNEVEVIYDPATRTFR